MDAKYEPSPRLKAALEALTDAEDLLQQRRTEVRAAVAEDLRANPEVTNPEMAEHLPWTGETVRSIAREYDVPRKRKPTVRSIKPKKRS
ncbi:hypothetical protein [Streptomyces bacillaris]|uniref:hypothetical protein n=1 Tax=Streptomyces bacillaris TaxID=68179 RepID=UPI00363268CB